MGSYTDNNYGGMNDSYGITKCKWKPRIVSAKRDFPDAFGYDVFSQLAKKHKVCEDHVEPDESEGGSGGDKGMFDLGCENDDFIPLETDSVSSESESCRSETGGSDYDIIPRMVNNVSEEEGDNYWSDWKTVSDDDSDDDEKLDSYTELRFHGVCLKEIRCYQTEDNALKIELKVDNLKKRKNSIVDESLGKESRTSESVNEGIKTYKQLCFSKRTVSAVRCYPPGCGPYAAFVSDEHYNNLQKNNIYVESFEEESRTSSNECVKTYEQLPYKKRRVSAVRCFPPGCGPDAEFLSDEDLKVAIDESRNPMLTCESCGMIDGV